MKKILLTFLLAINILVPTSLFAQEAPDRFTRTILPEVNKDIVKSNAGCRLLITKFEDFYFYPNNADTDPQDQISADLGSIRRFDQAVKKLSTFKDNFINVNFEGVSRNDVLGCAIVTGKIRMMYLSMFLSYALNMLAIVSGSISMLFIIFGGYQYVIGALTQSTDEAKKTIINALLGLLVSTGAWIIVNIVLAIITS